MREGIYNLNVFNAVEDGMKNIENRWFEELDLLLQRVLTLVMVLIDTTRETPPEQKATQGKDWDGHEEVDDNDEDDDDNDNDDE